MNTDNYEPELLSAKQLAGKLGRKTRYVRQMVYRGFRMIAGRTTLEAAMLWLGEHGPPFRRQPPKR